MERGFLASLPFVSREREPGNFHALESMSWLAGVKTGMGRVGAHPWHLLSVERLEPQDGSQSVGTDERVRGVSPSDLSLQWDLPRGWKWSPSVLTNGVPIHQMWLLHI